MIGVHLLPETITGMNRVSKDSLEVLQFLGKTPAPPGQCRDIMAQISIDAFPKPLYSASSWFSIFPLPGRSSMPLPSVFS